MSVKRERCAPPKSDRGSAIIIAAVGMIFILGMAGLAVDLASLYVARSQAQRAADAAALAGARAFTDQGCVTGDGGTLSGACLALAKQRAELVGNQNLIAGVSPGITDADITFPSTSTSDPQVEVIAGRGTYNGANHNNPLPTFFMKIFGVNTASVSAMATAEAYNPSGTGGAPVGEKCVKPWLFPNCDEFNTSESSPNCANGVGPFVENGAVARPVNYPNGALGEPYMLKPGAPSGAASPGQYYAAYIPPDSNSPSVCPSCASSGTGQGGTGSAALYSANISCCNQTPLVCGGTFQLNTTLQSNPGNMAGPTYQGVDCLIHQDTQSGGSSSCGQDYVQGSSNNCTTPSDASAMPALPVYPPALMPGLNNPYSPGGSQPISFTDSDSVATVPIYDGIISSGQNTVTVAGFLNLFLRNVASQGNPKGTVYAYVLAVVPCPSGGSLAGAGGSGNVVMGSGGSAIPVRLIHQ